METKNSSHIDDIAKHAAKRCISVSCLFRIPLKRVYWERPRPGDYSTRDYSLRLVATYRTQEMGARYSAVRSPVCIYEIVHLSESEFESRSEPVSVDWGRLELLEEISDSDREIVDRALGGFDTSELSSLLMALQDMEEEEEEEEACGGQLQ